MGVGDLLGKLFGGEPAKGDAPLRAYGKLPMYAEYRRLELSPGAPTAFSQWMDAGRLAWVNAMSKSGAGSTRPSRLFLRLPGLREIAVASVWDSRDTVGRVFPFSFFVIASPDALGENLTERLASAMALFEAFDAAHAELNRLGAGGDFYRLYAKRRLPLRPPDVQDRAAALRSQSGGVDASVWFKSFSPDGKLDPAIWFGTLVRRGQRWKGNASLASNLAISCPMIANVSSAAQALIWLEWLEPLAAKIPAIPWFVLPADASRNGASMHVALREPMPGDFQLLTSDESSYGFVERIGEMPTASTDSSSLVFVDPPTTPLGAWLRDVAATA